MWSQWYNLLVGSIWRKWMQVQSAILAKYLSRQKYVCQNLFRLMKFINRPFFMEHISCLSSLAVEVISPNTCLMHARTKDTQWSLFFHWNPELLGLGKQFGQINFRAFGIFGRFISTHFCTVSPLSTFSIIQPLLLQKLSLYIHIFIWDWDLNLGRKELGI